MSNSRKKSVMFPGLSGQTKTLYLESPGRAAVLVDNGQPTAMDFPDAHKALDWCEANRVIFCYLPAKNLTGN